MAVAIIIAMKDTYTDLIFVRYFLKSFLVASLPDSPNFQDVCSEGVSNLSKACTIEDCVGIASQCASAWASKVFSFPSSSNVLQFPTELHNSFSDCWLLMHGNSEDENIQVAKYVQRVVLQLQWPAVPDLHFFSCLAQIFVSNPDGSRILGSLVELENGSSIKSRLEKAIAARKKPLIQSLTAEVVFDGFQFEEKLQSDLNDMVKTQLPKYLLENTLPPAPKSSAIRQNDTFHFELPSFDNDHVKLEVQRRNGDNGTVAQVVIHKNWLGQKLTETAALKVIEAIQEQSKPPTKRLLKKPLDQHFRLLANGTFLGPGEKPPAPPAPKPVSIDPIAGSTDIFRVVYDSGTTSQLNVAQLQRTEELRVLYEQYVEKTAL